MAIIYQLTFANGKKYIGQTVQSLDDRICRHRVSSKKDQTVIARAWRKHGDPRAEVLAEVPEDQLNELERFLILEAGTHVCGPTTRGGRTLPRVAGASRSKIIGDQQGPCPLRGNKTKNQRRDEGSRSDWAT